MSTLTPSRDGEPTIGVGSRVRVPEAGLGLARFHCRVRTNNNSEALPLF